MIRKFLSRSLLMLVVSLVFLFGVTGVAAAVGKSLHTHPGYVTKIYSPWGKSYTHDADGKVKEYRGDHLPSNVMGRAHIAERSWIHYNYQDMNRLNATGCGWDRVMRHERAHTRGFAHGEGVPPNNDGIRQQNENPAYYTSVNIRCKPGSAGNAQVRAEETSVKTGPVLMTDAPVVE